MALLSGNGARAVLYILMNVASGTGIVFANKIVLSVYKFHYVYALTLIHTVVTMVRSLFFRFVLLSFFEALALQRIDLSSPILAGWDVDIRRDWPVSKKAIESQAGARASPPVLSVSMHALPSSQTVDRHWHV